MRNARGTASGRGKGARPALASLADLDRAAADPAGRILVRGATIVSMDSRVGDFETGDMLIGGGAIVAVGRDLEAAGRDAGAVIVDGAGAIVVPGMVDCHRHAWLGVLRGMIPDTASAAEYMANTHQGFAPHYKPADMYASGLVTALACLDAGITCMIDCSDNSRSAAHSDAAIQALFDSGIRAVHASGKPTFGSWDEQWPNDLERLQREYFASEDQLVTLRIFSRFLDPDDWRRAKRMGLGLSIDQSNVRDSGAALRAFAQEGLLSDRHTLNHGFGLDEQAWSIIKDSGISINACPRCNAQWSLGPASMALHVALAHGVRPGFSIDNDTAYGTDMFGEMQAALHLQRWSAHMARVQKQEPLPRLTNRDILEFATVNGARNAGLEHRIGSLSPGKQADFIMIRADHINTLPLTNAVATVVSYAHAGNVEAVFVAGRARKWDGRLVGVDLGRVRNQVERSRDALLARRGLGLDVVQSATATGEGAAAGA